MSFPSLCRTAATLALLAIASGGCEEADPVEPPPMADPPAPSVGALRVTVATNGPRQDADGYVATVDGNTSQNVASTGSVTFANLQPGDHSVDLTDFAANCPAPAESSKTASVVAGTTVDVGFTVTCGYLAYSANVLSMDVTVLETASFGVVGTIPLQNRPLRIAATPDGTSMYVSNAPAVSVVETATNTVVGEVTLTTPFALAATPDGSEVYVTDSSMDEVTVISTASNSVATTIQVEAGPHSYEPVFGLDGAFAYVSNPGANSVSIIDTDTHLVTTHLTVGASPTWLTVSPDGTRVYSVNSSDLSVIDTGTNSVLATVPLGTTPAGKAVVTPDGAFVFVLDLTDEEVWIVDAGTNSAVAQIPVGSGALRMAMSPDGAHVYLVDQTNQEVTVIGTNEQQVVGNVPLGVAPSTVDFTPDGAVALTANFSSDNVSVIDAATHSLLTTVSVGDGPVWLGITPN